MNEQDTLRILQYNVRKSREMVMATLLRDKRIQQYDILAIQEPWHNPYISTTHHPVKDTFHLCYPDKDEKGEARVCFFINKKLEHSKWQFTQRNGDACSIIITLSSPENQAEARTLAVHNIYNQHKDATERRSALPELTALLDEHQNGEQVIVGDFNLHHPLWGGDSVIRIEREARDLANIIEEYALTLTVPRGTITFTEKNAKTAIDLCMVTTGLEDRIVSSGIETNLDHDSDHLPITTILNLVTSQTEKKRTRRWKTTEAEKFKTALKSKLPELHLPRTKTALDKYTTEVVDAIWKAAAEATPETITCPKSREGWDAKCTRTLHETKRLKRQHIKYNTEETWEAYRTARNNKVRVIRKALQQTHRRRVEQAAESPDSLWRLAKWARNRGSQAPTLTPALTSVSNPIPLTAPEDKARLLKESFFPKPPETNLDDIANTTYPAQIELPPITQQEVEDAISEVPPDKAPGPDNIPNRILKMGSLIIVPHLTRIFEWSIKLGYCPEHFRKSTTIVLRKPGKDNYTVPKSYRPIALLNTIGKLMDRIVAKRLSYLVEKHQLLPQDHIGGRPLKSTEHALHSMVQKVHETWNQRPKQVTSLLLLDVSGAFDNVSHKRLIHNLRKRRIDEKTVKWIESFLSNRQTNIIIDGHKSQTYTVETGIPQGSPLSLSLYLFYNADLIDECNKCENITTIGYVDDIAILAWGADTTETCKNLNVALEKADQWASTHASVFAPEKFQLSHLTRSNNVPNIELPINSKYGEIKPQRTCKYLGVTIDTRMRWKPQIDSIQQKVSKSISALKSLAGSTWGVSLRDMRKIYTGVVVPQMLYACSVWSNSGDRYGCTKETLDKLRSLQAKAARAITGALVSTAKSALDIEAHLLPVRQQIWKHNMNMVATMLSCSDMQLLPQTTSINTTQNSLKGKPGPLRTIYQELVRRRKPQNIKTERIQPCIAPPWWKRPEIHIDTAEHAINTHETNTARDHRVLTVYTDGCCKDKQIGAAAVCLTTAETRKSQMGNELTSTVYAAEIEGISLALTIAKDDKLKGNKREKIIIYTDNQAAIRSCHRPKGKSGAYLLETVQQQIEELQQNGTRVVIKWIPAHSGIPGNELADAAAKAAAGWTGRETQWPQAKRRQGLRALKSILRTWICKQAITDWIEDWRNDKDGKATRRYTPIPTKKTIRLHEGYKKRQSAIYVQMRTEKIGLRDQLYQRHAPDISDPMCECQEGRQTVRHVLLECRQYRQIREQELNDIPTRTDLREILCKRAVATRAIKFMERTRLLKQFRAEAPE